MKLPFQGLHRADRWQTSEDPRDPVEYPASIRWVPIEDIEGPNEPDGKPPEWLEGPRRTQKGASA